VVDRPISQTGKDGQVTIRDVPALAGLDQQVAYFIYRDEILGRDDAAFPL
jgi:hypothetical protein